MSENKAPPQPTPAPAPGQSAPPGTPGDPASEAKARIALLQTAVRALETEVRVLQGRLRNLSPESQKALIEQNQVLKKRIPLLQQALMALLLDRHRSRTLIEQDVEVEAERKAIVDLCKSKQVNPELWKNIEF